MGVSNPMGRWGGGLPRPFVESRGNDLVGFRGNALVGFRGDALVGFRGDALVGFRGDALVGLGVMLWWGSETAVWMFFL